jgi:hypothetical protein
MTQLSYKMWDTCDDTAFVQNVEYFWWHSIRTEREIQTVVNVADVHQAGLQKQRLKSVVCSPTAAKACGFTG